MRTSFHHELSSAFDMILSPGTLSDSLQLCKCTTLPAQVARSLRLSQEHSIASHGFDQELGRVKRTLLRLLVQKDRHQASSCLLGMLDFGKPTSSFSSRLFQTGQPLSTVGTQVNR